MPEGLLFIVWFSFNLVAFQLSAFKTVVKQLCIYLGDLNT